MNGGEKGNLYLGLSRPLDGFQCVLNHALETHRRVWGNRAQ